MNTKDPFVLIKIFIEEIKKDLQAAEDSMIGEVYDLEDWKEELKEIENSTEELEAEIDEEEYNIKYRKEEYKSESEKLKGDELTQFKQIMDEQNKISRKDRKSVV